MSSSCFSLHLLPSSLPSFKQSQVATSKHRTHCILKNSVKSSPLTAISTSSPSSPEKPGLLLQYGAALAAMMTSPAMAVTGENNMEGDLMETVVAWAIVAVLYFIVFPPVIMNWLRLRWYKRKFFEMYLQFMFVFIFFPGLMLWAPFLNFRKFPRDSTMKYPWSTPKDDVPLYRER